MPDDIRQSPLHHPFEAVPDPGQSIQVADGIYWIRMPLPFALNHINLWLLEDGDGWTIVDTGLANDDTKELWRAQFDGPMGGKPVNRVIVTHFHPDHVGNAGWLAEVCKAPVWMSRTEWLMHQMLYMDDRAAFHLAQVDAYEEAGLRRDAGYCADGVRCGRGRGHGRRHRPGARPDADSPAARRRDRLRSARCW